MWPRKTFAILFTQLPEAIISYLEIGSILRLLLLLLTQAVDTQRVLLLRQYVVLILYDILNISQEILVEPVELWAHVL